MLIKNKHRGAVGLKTIDQKSKGVSKISSKLSSKHMQTFDLRVKSLVKNAVASQTSDKSIGKSVENNVFSDVAVIEANESFLLQRGSVESCKSNFSTPLNKYTLDDLKKLQRRNNNTILNIDDADANENRNLIDSKERKKYIILSQQGTPPGSPSGKNRAAKEIGLREKPANLNHILQQRKLQSKHQPALGAAQEMNIISDLKGSPAQTPEKEPSSSVPELDTEKPKAELPKMIEIPVAPHIFPLRQSTQIEETKKILKSSNEASVTENHTNNSNTRNGGQAHIISSIQSFKPSQHINSIIPSPPIEEEKKENSTKLLKSNKVSNEVSAVNQSEIDNYGYQTNYLMSNKMSASGQAHDEDSLHQRKTTS